ncbi:MAG: phosphoribosylformylglycinamidine synthase subunit PurS [Candidatus Methylacidiphilales bacterium]|nr:phosphoribosylformylglycinamidine synthase subunit PurS [Candidatus Methylacidiphilales bacterium]
MKVEIFVTPKKSVFDPQGDAVLRCLHTQGLEKAVSVRIGKFIELEVDASEGEVSGAKLDEICRDILSNPVIEDYTVRIADVVKATPNAAAAPAPIVAAAAKPKAKKSATVAAPASAPIPAPAPTPEPVAAEVPVTGKATTKKVGVRAPVEKTEKTFAFAKSKGSIGKVLPLKDATKELKAKKK